MKRRELNIGDIIQVGYNQVRVVRDEKDCLMIGDASGLEGQFSDSDKKTAENFGIDYMDVSEFVNVYGEGV